MRNMSDLITLEMALNLPNAILEQSEKSGKFNTLISKSNYDKFETKKLKLQIVKIFERYKEILYLNQFPNDVNSISFELKENMITNSANDIVANLVDKRIKMQFWATDFYYALLRASSKLTYNETKYLIGTFFKNQTEDTLSEILSICRNTLRGIKKSCLVKLWVELEPLSKECK